MIRKWSENEAIDLIGVFNGVCRIFGCIMLIKICSERLYALLYLENDLNGVGMWFDVDLLHRKLISTS